jgi:hypothetical protein
VFVEERELAGIADAIEHKFRSHVSSLLQARARLLGKADAVPVDRDSDADVSALIQALAHWREHAGTEA